MSKKKHGKDAYFLAYFYTLTRNNRGKSEHSISTARIYFEKLEDFANHCFDNISSIRHYYLGQQKDLDEGRGSFPAFLSAKSDEFWKNEEIPLPSWSKRDRTKFGGYGEKHEETYQRWKDHSFESIKSEVDLLLNLENTLSPTDLGNAVPVTPTGDSDHPQRQGLMSGYVYVIENKHPAFKGWKKIGFTSSPEQRMSAYRTYEPNAQSEFVFLATIKSKRAYEIEQKTHSYLNQRLLNPDNSTRKGEWYYISIEDAIDAIRVNWIGTNFPLN